MTEKNIPANTSDPGPDSGSHRSLDMWGGSWAALIPTCIFIGTLVWLSLTKSATITGFLVGGWAAIVAGLLLTRNKQDFAETIVRGFTDQTGMVVIIAFIFAGVFGQILSNSGLVDGFLWIGLKTHLSGAAFVCLAFVLTCLFATGIGTSVGTYLAVIPVLYPAGVSLGADPTILAVGILAGGTFGDNLAPISDSTISSAYTSKAEMGDVVKTRLPLTLVSAVFAFLVFAIFGGGGQASEINVDTDVSPLGLIMVIPFIVVVALALRRNHILIALVWGTISAIAIAFIAGLMSPSDVFSIPGNTDDSTGLIEDGITGVSGAVLFVLFILAVAEIMKNSGLMEKILLRIESYTAQGVRGAELAISGVSLLFSIPLGANAPAILLVGPTIGRPLGVRHKLAPARIANLMDCSVNTMFYILPWHNAVIPPHSWECQTSALNPLAAGFGLHQQPHIA
ncbi:Na+/H+ antiporter NhaC family protein [Halomonas piscis]|uniref:Na+/H+ antiporter NhaC family protein n=1 Tax=Halomonas piscis TaxID=3031727 RepID=UPI00289ED960|nr:Na+/H+ antiporter NhaC family protein [Halomonas piscis]